MCSSGQELGLGIHLQFSSCSRKRKGHISFISFADLLTFFNAATLSQHFGVRGQGVSQTSVDLSRLHTGPVRALEMHITLEDKTVLLILWPNFFFSLYFLILETNISNRTQLPALRSGVIISLNSAIKRLNPTSLLSSKH